MMPVKEILELKHFHPRPPVMVIDEMSIKTTTDAGPVCGCDEKLQVVKNYVPFMPGTVNPYKRRKFEPEAECLEIFWRRLGGGCKDLIFEEPIAVHQSEVPCSVGLPREPQGEITMCLTQPKYAEDYIVDKLKQCETGHSEGVETTPRNGTNDPEKFQ